MGWAWFLLWGAVVHAFLSWSRALATHQGNKPNCSRPAGLQWVALLFFLQFLLCTLASRPIRPGLMLACWLTSLVPRPRPALGHLQYGKAGRTWYVSFLTWGWRDLQMAKNSERKSKVSRIVQWSTYVQVWRWVCITVTLHLALLAVLSPSAPTFN